MRLFQPIDSDHPQRDYSSLGEQISGQEQKRVIIPVVIWVPRIVEPLSHLAFAEGDEFPCVSEPRVDLVSGFPHVRLQLRCLPKHRIQLRPHFRRRRVQRGGHVDHDTLIRVPELL